MKGSGTCGTFKEHLDLSRFDAAPLIAFSATNETDYGAETGAAHPRQRIQSWGSFALGGNITSSDTATGKSSLRLKNYEPSLPQTADHA